MEAIVQAGVGRIVNRIGLVSASTRSEGICVFLFSGTGLDSRLESEKATAGPSAALGMTVGVVERALFRHGLES